MTTRWLADYLDGGAGDDYLSGDEGGDQILGGTWNDIITGGLGVDYMNGGEGDDVYLLSPGDSPVIDGNVDFIDDAEGSNTIVLGTNVNVSDFLVYESGPGVVLAYSANDYVYLNATIISGHPSDISIGAEKVYQIEKFFGCFLKFYSGIRRFYEPEAVIFFFTVIALFEIIGNVLVKFRMVTLQINKKLADRG